MLPAVHTSIGKLLLAYLEVWVVLAACAEISQLASAGRVAAS